MSKIFYDIIFEKQTIAEYGKNVDEKIVLEKNSKIIIEKKQNKKGSARRKNSNLEILKKHIDELSETFEEKSEYWMIIEEVIQFRLTNYILSRLEKKKHEEFLGLVSENIFSESVMDYLVESAGNDIKTNIEAELIKISEEIGKSFE
jgi:hypothetical protein